MKLIFILLIAFLSSCALNISKQDLETVINSGKQDELTSNQVAQGLKEALRVGISNAIGVTSKKNGFYLNELIKIPFPIEAIEVKNTLLKYGLKKEVENFEKSLNRSAEKAAPLASDIFLSAIKNMTLKDAFAILNGNQNEATLYLKNNTYVILENAFMPLVSKTLKEVEVTRYWNPIISKYNQIPFTKKYNPNLDQYVTREALNGLFLMLENEEKQIRIDPAKRVTELLQKVFSSVKK